MFPFFPTHYGMGSGRCAAYICDGVLRREWKWVDPGWLTNRKNFLFFCYNSETFFYTETVLCSCSLIGDGRGYDGAKTGQTFVWSSWPDPSDYLVMSKKHLLGLSFRNCKNHPWTNNFPVYPIPSLAPYRVIIAVWEENICVLQRKTTLPLMRGEIIFPGRQSWHKAKPTSFPAEHFPVGAQGSIGYTRSEARFTTPLDRILCHLLVLWCERIGITNYRDKLDGCSLITLVRGKRLWWNEESGLKV